MAEEPPKTLRDFARRTSLPQVALERLAVIGALRAFVPTRRDAVWKVQALAQDEAGLLTDAPAREEPGPAPVPAMDPTERLAADFSVLGLSIESHPIALWRPHLRKQQVLRCSEVNRAPAGAKVKVAGLAIVTQRPGTAKGMVFITLEDETGLVNAVLSPAVWARFREARDEVLLLCAGTIEREEDVVNLMVTSVQRLAPRRDAAGAQTRQFR
jgi:error-prone DNA polymerase